MNYIPIFSRELKFSLVVLYANLVLLLFTLDSICLVAKFSISQKFGSSAHVLVVRKKRYLSGQVIFTKLRLTYLTSQGSSDNLAMFISKLGYSYLIVNQKILILKTQTKINTKVYSSTTQLQEFEGVLHNGITITNSLSKYSKISKTMNIKCLLSFTLYNNPNRLY